jgi:hypothetical protein
MSGVPTSSSAWRRAATRCKGWSPGGQGGHDTGATCPIQFTHHGSTARQKDRGRASARILRPKRFGVLDDGPGRREAPAAHSSDLPICGRISSRPISAARSASALLMDSESWFAVDVFEPKTTTTPNRAAKPATITIGSNVSAFRRECGFPATKLAAKPVMFATTPQRSNQSIGRTDQGATGNQYMDEGQIGVRSAGGRSGEPGWGLLLLVWFAGNVVVATLSWFLVGLLLK